MERVEEAPAEGVPSQKKGWGESAYRQIFGSTIRELFGIGPKCGYAVSYTHLTLPTNREV